MKIIGLLEYSLYKHVWLDKNISASWLRVFERLSKKGYECHALLAEPNESSEAYHDGVFYHFIQRKSPISRWVDTIESIDGNLLFYNNSPCPWGGGEFYTKHFKGKIKQVLRSHFEPKTAFRTKTEIPYNVDFIICPLEIHIDYMINKYGIDKTKFDWVPFGTSLDAFSNKRMTRDIDFLSSCSQSRKLKNYAVVEAVFKILEKRGYKTLNVLGKPKNELVDILNSGKIFYYPSLTEASGSRILIEAVACGCVPVVDALCDSCSYVANLFGGYVVDSKSKTDTFKALGFDKPPDDIADELELILKKESKIALGNLGLFDLEFEILRLQAILEMLCTD